MRTKPTQLDVDILPAREYQEIAQIYHQHHHWLYSWLYKKLGCMYQAQDFSHDTFINLLKKQCKLKLREPRAYLTTIAHGLVVNHWRRTDIEKAFLNSLNPIDEHIDNSLEKHAIVLEALMQIDSALDGLAIPVREAYLLSQLEGLTYKKIALRLQVSERTIKNYMAQAMLHCLMATQ